jgi:hypothetical protein
MTKQEAKSFMGQFAAARKEITLLRKTFPSLFDKQGRPLVATLTFPRVGK